ncbi:MAG: tetratricopeptide repeat protein [Tannerella sp.]|jgi:hypothetical protein|nr:tetratricopeptide repeat protein [Tannerella sp.]
MKKIVRQIAGILDVHAGAPLPIFAILLFFMSLASCRSYKTFDIQTYKPAAITFPRHANTLLIVNNVGQQPDSVGHRIEGYINKDIRISADSTAYDLCFSLGRAIAESPVFADVRMCEDTIRTDSAFYELNIFSKDDVRRMCRDYGVDAMISLDRLIFNTKLTRNIAEYGFYSGSGMEIEALGELRVYWRDQNEGYSVPFRDSLFWYDDAGIVFSQEMMFSPEDVQDAMRYLSSYLGEKLQNNFVPYWESEGRWYYTSISSEWKQGSVFAASEKWDRAIAVWEPLLAKTTNKNKQGRLYSNLALCNEMTGNFEKAVEYAEKSVRLLNDALGEDNSFSKLQKLYLDVLKKRVADEEILEQQLREK